MKKAEICYLCGKSIIEDELTRDHVPPRIFFPKTLRTQGFYKNLESLPAHRVCNNKFTIYEEYVGRLLGLFVGDQTKAGNALFHEFVKQVKDHPVEKTVENKILGSISNKYPSGEILSPDKSAVTVNLFPIQEVFWKIARGVWFKIYGEPILESTQFKILYYPPPFSILPKSISKLMEATPKTKTSNPEIFHYRYAVVKIADINLHSLFMIFWDSFVVHLMFHDDNCLCETCVAVSVNKPE